MARLTTDYLIEQARICNIDNFCIGDTGEAKCVFCPCCVLSLDEIISNTEMVIYEIASRRGLPVLKYHCCDQCSNLERWNINNDRICNSCRFPRGLSYPNLFSQAWKPTVSEVSWFTGSQFIRKSEHECIGGVCVVKI